MRNKTEMGRCFLVLKPYFLRPLAILKEIKGESKMSKESSKNINYVGSDFFPFLWVSIMIMVQSLSTEYRIQLAML